MRCSLVLTIIGPDRPGLVEAVASTIADRGGNWVESRMARLGGQFAGILLVDAPQESRDDLRAALEGLGSQGLRIGVEETDAPGTPGTPGTPGSSGAPGSFGVSGASGGSGGTLRFELLGHDRPGIVRHVSRALAQRKVNVVDLETEIYSAPMSGEPLFRAAIEATVPEGADAEEVRAALQRAAEELSMDLTFE